MAGQPVLAVALLQDIAFGTDMITYLEGLDATLVPYGGRFVVHRPAPTVIEGELSGRSALIVIEFPDRASAEQWYDSPAYQEILPLRTRNSRGVALIVDTVAEDYTARQGLEVMLNRSRDSRR
jgi:uncharacterized protein (DUF1330 family)